MLFLAAEIWGEVTAATAATATSATFPRHLTTPAPASGASSVAAFLFLLLLQPQHVPLPQASPARNADDGARIGKGQVHEGRGREGGGGGAIQLSHTGILV